MTINITSGEELNKILRAKYPEEAFVPFNEAMITETYTAAPFTDEFIRERAAVHGVTEESYRENLGAFLDLLGRLKDYDALVLWFGDEPFCRENRRVLLETLRQRNYQGGVVLHIVDEYTGEIQTREVIHL